LQADAFMHVPDKPGKKENRKANFFPVFSFFLLVALFSSVLFYSVSFASAADGEEELQIILINGDDVYIRSGQYHTFLQDYQLYVKGADIDGKRIWLELRREGISLQDGIATEGSQFVYSQNSTEVLNLTVSTVYEGADGVLVKFSPVYQYLNPKLPMPQTQDESNNSSENASSEFPELETQAEGFDMPIFLLGLGTVLLVTSLFAGKMRRK